MMEMLNFEPAALVLSLMCLIYSLTTKRRQIRMSKGIRNSLLNQHVLFLILIITNIFSSASSVGGACLQVIASEKVVFWQYFLHAVYFLFHTSLSICFALYIMNVNGANVGRSRMFYILFFLPYVVSELLVLTNGFTGAIFYMDDQFVYHRGSFIFICYVTGFLYLVMGFFFFFKYKEAISNADSRMIGAMMVVSAVGVTIQAIRSDIMVELFAESLSFLGLMLMLEEKSGHIDPVTGALNKVALVDACRRIIETDQPCCIVFIKLTDMDLFAKIFNGRENDSLLMQISTWFTSIASEQELYYFRDRNFALLYAGNREKEAEAAADKILNRFEQEWKTGKIDLKLEVAVSVVRIPADLSDMDDLMELLVSEYQKKDHGSRLVSFEELSAFQHHRRIEKALHEAVENGKLRVWYQPIWSAEEKRIVSAEALLRIDSDELRKISPEVYIPIAEQCGIIREIGLFVFEEVCRFLSNEHMQELGLSYIELNLSVYQFMYDDLVKRFEKIRSKYGVSVEALNLEITESSSTGEAPVVQATMKRLREIGYTFSLDDFGTGYSNFMQLISSNYKNVKIDKAILWDAERNETTARLLDSMIRVIRSLGYNVVQEGVETEEQLARTVASGGNLIQGYYFSKPLPEEEFVRYLEKAQK